MNFYEFIYIILEFVLLKLPAGFFVQPLKETIMFFFFFRSVFRDVVLVWMKYDYL